MKLTRSLSLILILSILFSLICTPISAADSGLLPDSAGQTIALPDSAGDVSITRYAGEDRFATSLAAADAMKKALGVQKFDAVIVASGLNFADALSGSYLAAAKKAPILLAYKDKQNSQTAAYIQKSLKSGGTVYILGGYSAVPASMDALLTGFNIKRLDGANRFETNLMILKAAGIKNKQEILVCTSTNFADSLSASATGMPILLVYNEKGKLTDAQKKYLSGLNGCSFRIIGGKNAVSEGMVSALSAYGKVSRLSGSDRFTTSVEVARSYFASPSQAVLAYAGNFPDGLCGGPLAYAMGAPLILTMDKYASIAAEYTADYDITNGVILGGNSLISDKSAFKIFAQTDIPDTTEPPTEPAQPTEPSQPTAPTEPQETVPAPETNAVYEAMVALKPQYPEGMPWTNDNYYAWNGGIYGGGYGCAGFAFILSDAAFGDLPARPITADPSKFDWGAWVPSDQITLDTSITIEDIRVGDILRMYSDTHSVIVLEVHEDHLIIAEGNYNSSIHWGRTLTIAELDEIDYILTRYPAE